MPPTSAPPEDLSPIERLQALVRLLRSDAGCPWDREQKLDDVRSFLVEEAHEVAAAIDAEDWVAVREELGDLLFQIAFVCSLAEEAVGFGLDAVARQVTEKMITRHPHVFGDERLSSATEVASAWEQRKLERGDGLLAGVPPHLPALVGAHRIGQKAAGFGFDWASPREVLHKVHEELSELEELLPQHTAPSAAHSRDSTDELAPAALEEELGDLLQAIASLSRHLNVDPERALARSNLKFRRRFLHVERGMSAVAGEGSAPLSARRERMEALWNEAKEREADAD